MPARGLAPWLFVYAPPQQIPEIREGKILRTAHATPRG